MYLGVPTEASNWHWELGTGNSNKGMRHTLPYEMKWNLLFGSALDRARAGQDEAQAGTLLCSCDPAHMLPTDATTAAAGGACGEREQGRGRMRPWWLLAPSWKTQYLNNLLPCERTSSADSTVAALLPLLLTHLPPFPCRLILNPIKGQLFVYVLSFKLSSNVDNNPVGRKTVPCMHLWLQTIAAKSTRTHTHIHREIACPVYVGTIICSITYAVESYEPIISVVNTNIHNPYQGPCPLCPRLSSSDEVLCTRTHVRVIVCQCPQLSWEYSPAMSILLSMPLSLLPFPTDSFPSVLFCFSSCFLCVLSVRLLRMDSSI